MPLFKVQVTRISTSTKDFVVMADDEDQATAKAIEQAADSEFSEQNAEYETEKPVKL